MLPILQIGPFAVQTPGLILLLALWLGLNLAERHAARHNLHPETLYNLTFISLAAGLLGARLFYVAQNLPAFAADPAGLISLNPGLLDPAGGAAAGIIASLIYGQRKKLPLPPTLDALTPALAVLVIGTALANLASGVGFGLETSLPWGIELWGAKRHPTQVYEALAASAILLLLWPGRGAIARRLSHPGSQFLIFLALSALSRLTFDAFRADSPALANGWRLAQIQAWLLLALALWGLNRLARRKAA